MTTSSKAVNFVGTKNTISVNSGAERVAVNCGKGSCLGRQSHLCMLQKYSPFDRLLGLVGPLRHWWKSGCNYKLQRHQELQPVKV